ncbi:MAG: hypothetical protein LBL50_03705 [Candidatus Margulisbacteria bacterium]|jgi:hypothetical protein|nr:hypothetical protein [Candidatus Margulisiibacteriota bacterium]
MKIERDDNGRARGNGREYPLSRISARHQVRTGSYDTNGEAGFFCPADTGLEQIKKGLTGKS